MRFLGWFVGVGLLVAPYAVAAPDCALKKVASFDVSVESGSLLTSAQIEGKQVPVVLDTGASFNLVDQKLAEELKLARSSMMGYQVTDAAGKISSHMVTAHSVSIGDWTATNVPFVVSGENGPTSMQAIFGNPFLEANDLELDLAHGKVNLFLPDHCPGQVVYWTHDYVPIPIRLQQSGHIALPVTLDGRETFAMFDTGASRTLVSKRMAESDFSTTPGQADKPDGFMIAGSGTRVPFYKHVFGKFDIGGIEFHNTELLVAPDRVDLITKSESGNPHVASERAEQPVETPIILGLPHISKLRLYFAFKEHMVYVTPANAH